MRLTPPSRTSVPLLALFCALSGLALGADGELDVDRLIQRAQEMGRLAQDWFVRTPPAERVTWGGLAVCAALALGVLVERSLRLRRNRVMPRAFTDRFLDRLRDGKLDRGKATDFCEMNPSPAARVAMAAVRRWGRSAGELERAAVLARQLEGDRLRRHVGTLRRVAALSPLLGLLGALFHTQRALQALPVGANWAPTVAAALGPLTVGVAMAILALVAYDGLMGRVESLTNDLDRMGAAIVDAVHIAAIETKLAESRPHAPSAGRGPHYGQPHPGRVESPDTTRRDMSRTHDDD
jgi:biopolymer transport protein ExbB